MEIRSSLRKIDNYLKIVADLNRAILEEGTMAPEELQIMKKYLFVCIERIEDIQIKLGLSTVHETKSDTLTPKNILHQEQEVILKSSNENLIEEDSRELSQEEVVEEKKTTFDVLNSIKDNITESQIIKNPTTEILEENAIEVEKIVERLAENNSILIEPVIFLSADLPSVKYNSGINFSDYEQSIIDLDDAINKPFSEQENQLTGSNVLVADDVATEPDKIEFEHLTIAANIKQEQEVNTAILVRDDDSEDKMFVSFKPQEKEADEKHINLVDTSNDKNDFISKTTSNGVEYESILNKKSLSESIALNDKFIFVRELFGSQFSEYESSIKEIDIFENHQEALDFCVKVLATKYNWDSKKGIADRFLNILKKNMTYKLGSIVLKIS